MTYAFTFDATFCSGCKACQAACKDKNDLPLGVLWRKVIEVTGGTWQQDGDAWNNTVFAYNVSIACNHCIHPKCAGICPADAYIIREDGIVILDTTKCMGCGYCSWACPYGAPQYNPIAGHMTKCNFCSDQIDQGLPPACVAACPMRVLEFTEMTTATVLATNEVRLWDDPPESHPYPLPNYSHTQPRLAIKPHAAMTKSEAKFVANREEIQPHVSSAWEDVPLMLFTLFAQMAVGGFWAALWMFPHSWTSASHQPALLRLPPLLWTGGCLGAAILASLAHLGTKKKAIFALRNLHRSWLSREILFTGLFTIAWLLSTLESAIWRRSTIELLGVTATLGFGLVYSMSQVYRLRAVPAWNTWRTNLSFILSALLLGQCSMAALLAYESNAMDIPLRSGQWMIVAGSILILLLLQLVLISKTSSYYVAKSFRIALILTGVALIVISWLKLGAVPSRISMLFFLIVLLEEGMGKWVFYQARTRVSFATAK